MAPDPGATGSAAEAPRTLDIPGVHALAASVLRAAGASACTAESLARAAASAERADRRMGGLAGIPGYASAIRDGRLDGHADPVVSRPRPGVVRVDARDGAAHLAFDRALDTLVDAAREQGSAVLSVANSFTSGELGYFSRTLAGRGLVALVCAHSPALMSAHGSRGRVTGTNPMAFSLPDPAGGTPRTFDQASSVTAWADVTAAARREEELPPGVVVDGAGRPTTDPRSALDGAILPFGGVKGANIGFMVEMLAVLSGADFSLDAAPFDTGSKSPRVGLFALALDPAAFDPGYVTRVEAHLASVAAEHGADFGRRHTPRTEVEVSASLLRRLREAAGPGGVVDLTGTAAPVGPTRSENPG
ncbi:Ldh family oxidoreductase [Brevibacterium litoralis]|uniref:Ldh family oxidoreductase n=1 Tax=Brevibacterium litoralis TaxID=3138935 RepID=UPI0032EF9309